MHPIRACALISIAGGLFACGGGSSLSLPPEPVPPATPAAPDPCRIVSDAARPATVVVAVTDVVDPRGAPVPVNDADRLVFRHLYATAARRDCTGAVHPNLAIRILSDTSNVWVVELVPGSFSDGTPITADAVIDQWRSVAAANPEGVTSMRAVRERTLEVTFAEPMDSVPALFTDAAYAVGGARAPSGWSAASSVYEVDPASTSTTRKLRLRPRADMRQPGIEIRVAPGADTRDLLDQGTDLVVTRDPLAIAYARADSSFRDIPLPWDRVYALVAGGSDTSASTRRSLAEAVRAESRIALGEYWWMQSPMCRVIPPRPMSRSPRILYSRTDATARDLAERTVALARRYPTLAAALGASSTGYIAVPVPPEVLLAALTQGSEAGYIVVLPRLAPASCVTTLPLPSTANVTPLVETRARAFLRRGTTGLLIDADGGVRLDAAGQDPSLP